MEPLIGLFALGLAGVLLAMPIVALVAFTRANQALRELEHIRSRLEALGRRVAAEGSHAEERVEPAAPSREPLPAAPAPPAAPAGESLPPRLPAPAVAPLPPLPPRPTVAATPPRPAKAAAPPGAALPGPAAGADFATSLGPKILVGAGGLPCTIGRRALASPPRGSWAARCCWLSGDPPALFPTA